MGEEQKHLRAVAPSIVQTSLFVFDSTEEFKSAFDYQCDSPSVYSRMSNPTVRIAEKKLADLEQTEEARLFVSGMAAISAAILACVEADSHVICVDTVYGPTRQLLEDYLPRFRVGITFVEGSDPDEFKAAIRPETKLIYLESPSSLLYRMQDIEAVSALAHHHGIPVLIDNSYASPLFQQPVKFGADVVLHSATKYIGGHSDTVAGLCCSNRQRMTQMIKDEVGIFGGALPPFPGWLITRSLRTLTLRMKAHQDTANELAAWLREQDGIDDVIHVGLPDFAQADLRDKQMTGTGGLFTFMPTVQEEEPILKFIEALELFQLGVSWGGHESLAVPLHPQPMHWKEPRWVIRLFVGLEDPEDLKEDILQAMKKAGWV